MPKNIVLRNAKENNLKNISLEIPENKVVAVTGLSGSGKSSLVNDVIAKESQRRYFNSFSSYARQFVGKMKRPEIESIDLLPPAILVNQKTTVTNTRSTLGTLSGLYDYLRLLFARLGENNNPNVKDRELKMGPRYFSFNSTYGACQHCKGIGTVDTLIPNLLIGDPSKSLRDGAIVTSTTNSYIMYSQVTIDVLNQVCNAEGFNVDTPWQDLSEYEKNVFFYGSNKIKIPFGKHTLESRMKWSGITAKPREEGFYKGIIPVMEEILKRDRNPSILKFVRTLKCDHCNGSRLKKITDFVTINSKNITDVSNMELSELHEFLLSINNNTPLAKAIIEPLLQRIEILCNLGLEYLSCNRNSTSLSGGEAQRLRLAKQLSNDLRGVLYILDEPSIGLHHKEMKNLIEMLYKLRNKGNSLIVVEHDKQGILNSEHIIDIGPKAGVNGGKLLYNGSTDKFLKHNNENLTLNALNEEVVINNNPRKESGNINIFSANKHNITNEDFEFKLGCFNLISGVSGAGKTTLAFNILAENLKNQSKKINCKDFIINGDINKIIYIDQKPIGKTVRSNPATYTSLSNHIRDIFAALKQSKDKGWKKGRFSFNVKGGRCEKCEGAGIIQMGMNYLGNVDIVCEKCEGKRFNKETLEIEYKGKNIYDIFELSVDEALSFFGDDNKSVKRILTCMQDLGLGYIKLGQPSTQLSGGEAQRIKLAEQLQNVNSNNNIYILDEPSSGLHPYDVKILLKSLNTLVDKGNTVIVIEHDIDFIAQADFVIDLGPDSGKNGGRLVFSGSPYQLSSQKNNHSAKMFSEKIIPCIEAPKKGSEFIEITNISTNNIKNIDVKIPVNKLSVVSGVSGSGKSSLVYDTIYQEAKKQFTSTLNTASRRLIKGKQTAIFDTTNGLFAPIVIGQNYSHSNPRSTVATLSGLHEQFRYLYSRIAIINNKNYSASHFSFNNELGACKHCGGMGFEYKCDPNKLISNPEKKIGEGAMKSHKLGRFYEDIHGQYFHTLKAAATYANIDFDMPWQEISEEVQNFIMYGSGEQEYDVKWEYKRKNNEGVHLFTAPWLGFAKYIDIEFEKKHADKRGDLMLALMKKVNCSVCDSQRLNTDVLEIKLNNKNIADLCRLNIEEAIEFFTKNSFKENEKKIFDNISDNILDCLDALKGSGLQYLQLDRSCDTLSGGELQRVIIASQLISGLKNLLIILDEPSAGLHDAASKNLINLLYKLRDKENTIIVVEHDKQFIKSADYIIEMGKGAGELGGDIIAKGGVSEILNNSKSLIADYLSKENRRIIDKKTVNLNNSIKITSAYANNLKNIDVDLPLECICTIKGISGSGKSSLLFDTLEASLDANRAINCSSISGTENIDSFVSSKQDILIGSALSTTVTYTDIFDKIKQLFKTQETAKERAYTKQHFSYNGKLGGCEKCNGKGYENIFMNFMDDIKTVCETCGGNRYKSEILDIKYKGKNISEVLDMSYSQAIEFLHEEKKIISELLIMQKAGLEYLKLGQSTSVLSGGEKQRLKLAKILIKGKSKRCLFILDEPSTGLHFKDIDNLLHLFRELTNQGHSIILSEHNSDIIYNSDYTVELGPGAGDKGGGIMLIENTTRKDSRGII